MKIVNKFLTFREEQFEHLQKGVHQCGMKLGDVTTVNLTMLNVCKLFIISHLLVNI